LVLNINMAVFGGGTFYRNNFRGRYNDSQGDGGGGFEAKCIEPLPTEPPYTTFIGNLQSDIVHIDMFSDLTVNAVKLVHDSDTGKCNEEALKYDGTFWDNYVKDDISRYNPDFPSSADIANEIWNIEENDVTRLIEEANEAKKIAKLERKLADDFEKDREKVKKEDPILYELLKDSLNVAKIFANTSELNVLDRTRNIDYVIKEAAYAKSVAEEYKQIC